MEKYRDIVVDAMNDLMQRDVVCDFLIESGKEQIIVKNTYSIDAYMKTIDVSKNENKDASCYMYAMGHKAVSPVFEVADKKFLMSGVLIGGFDMEINEEILSWFCHALAKSRMKNKAMEYYVPITI